MAVLQYFYIPVKILKEKLTLEVRALLSISVMHFLMMKGIPSGESLATWRKSTPNIDFFCDLRPLKGRRLLNKVFLSVVFGAFGTGTGDDSGDGAVKIIYLILKFIFDSNKTLSSHFLANNISNTGGKKIYILFQILYHNKVMKIFYFKIKILIG